MEVDITMHSHPINISEIVLYVTKIAFGYYNCIILMSLYLISGYYLSLGSVPFVLAVEDIYERALRRR